MILVLAAVYLGLFLGLVFDRRFGIFIAALIVPSLYPFVIKPILFESIGSPSLYQEYFDPDFVFIGMSIEVLWLLSLTGVAYVMRRTLPSRPFLTFYRSHVTDRALDIFLVLMILALAFLFYIAGDAVFAGNREVSLTTLNPMLRVVFPILLFGQVVPIAYLIQCVVQKRYGIRAALASIALFSVFYVFNQRGMIIQGFLLLLALLVHLGRLGYLRAGVFVLAGGLIGLYAKILNFMLVGVGSADLTFLSLILDGPDGVALQVWSIALSYIDDYGYTFGSTLAYSVFGVVPHTFRVALGVMTVTDVLNVYYNVTQYIGFGFGFNGTLTQDLFLSFGWYSVFLMPVFSYMGIFVARSAVRCLHSGRILDFVAFSYVALLFLGSGFQTLHWWLVIGFFCIVGRIRVKG